MVIKTVIALLLFSQGALIEHTMMPSVHDCLKTKREMLRNMSDSVQITCAEVQAEIKVIQGKEFIQSLQKQ
jgi:hypothetical protein